MYVLVEYNNKLDKNLFEIKKLNLIPIILFKINFINKNQIKEDIIKLTEEKLKLNLEKFAILINLEKLENNTNNFINDLKKDFNLVIGQGGLNKINQFFIEQTNIDFLLNPQNSSKKLKIDFIHHFNSGLNHILCKEIKKKKIKLIFTLNNFENKYNIKEIGRINQNIKFAKKYKIPININFIIKNINQIKSKIELNKIYSLFEISTEQSKESLNLLKYQLKINKLKQSKNYISKQIQILN